jgi:SHS2 domain-containing protein
MKFTPIEHPSDLALRAEGQNLKEAFEATALGMFAFIVDLSHVAEKEVVNISAAGSDPENLLVNFLNELLYLADARSFLIKGICILSLSNTSLTAEALGEKINPARHKILHSIKAATYNQLKINAKKDGVEITVVFDV